MTRPALNPVQANGFDMADFCPDSEVASENPAQASCAYAANAGSEGSYATDGTTEKGVMTDHFSEGGTSLSSPLWLGMWALVQAHHDAGNSSASSLGFASPLIYSLAQGQTKAGSGTSDDFTDITVGASPLPAHPGWDVPTGWGSPNLKNLIADASDTPGQTAPAVTTGRSARILRRSWRRRQVDRRVPMPLMTRARMRWTASTGSRTISSTWSRAHSASRRMARS